MHFSPAVTTPQKWAVERQSLHWSTPCATHTAICTVFKGLWDPFVLKALGRILLNIIVCKLHILYKTSHPTDHYWEQHKCLYIFRALCPSKYSHILVYISHLVIVTITILTLWLSKEAALLHGVSGCPQRYTSHMTTISRPNQHSDTIMLGITW